MLKEVLGDSNMRTRATGYRWLSIVICLAAFITLGGAPSEASTATPACSTTNLSLGHGDKVSEATGEGAVIFTLTNHGRFTCHLYGHPGVSLYDNKGRVMPFRYTWAGTQYVSQTPPKMVVLRPGARAYFLVAKYRCDIGLVMEAKTIRVYPPNTTQQLVGNAAPFVNGPSFWYCKGGAKDPGQLVEISPVRAHEQFM